MKNKKTEHKKKKGEEMLIRTIEVNGEKRIISSKKIVFSMPNGETLVVEKGEIGAVCDGRTQISDDAWASKDVYLKDTIILGKVIVLGDTSIDHCCIEYFGEENSSQNSGILIEGKNTLENTFIKGNKIKIKNSRVKSSNILNHAEIFDSDVCHSYVSDFSKICNGAKVEECNICGHSDVDGKCFIRNSFVKNSSEISGNAKIENCTIEKSTVKDNAEIKGEISAFKPSITDSVICGNAKIEGDRISILSSTVKDKFKIGMNIFVSNSCLGGDNSSYTLGGEKDSRVVVVDANIKNPFDYFIFKTADNTIHVIYAGPGLKGGYMIRKWYPKGSSKPVPSYPVPVNIMREMCGNVTGKEKYQKWANMFVNGLTDKDIGIYVKKAANFLTELFGNIDFFRSTSYKDILVWSMIQFASEMLNTRTYNSVSEKGKALEKDIVTDIANKKTNIKPRLFITKKVFDKICYDTNKSEEEVLEKLNTVGCVFVDF